MKLFVRLMLVAGMLILPLLVAAQDVQKDQIQKQSVTFMVRDGDSLVPKPVDVAYNPAKRQDKQAVPYDQAPEARTRVNPKYPEAATKAGTEGTVWTKVSIDEKGKVTNVIVAKSDAEIFNQPAIDAAMKWEFKPAMKDGKPVAVEVQIPFRFALGKGDEIMNFAKPGASPLSVAVLPRIGFRAMRQQPYLIGQSVAMSGDWYPESALKDKFEGLVLLKLAINLAGRVERVEVLSHAREDLDSAAVHLARTWTFIPGQYLGMPEKSVIEVPVSFSLGRQAK